VLLTAPGIRMFRILAASLLVVLAVVIGWAGFTWYRAQYGDEAYGAPFVLVDQRGHEITEQAFRGHPSAVFFGFTHCPLVCPTTLYELNVWLEELGDETAEVRAYFVSVDPERDTPAILDVFISNFSERITGITGKPEDVAAMLKAFGIYAKRVDEADGGYTMDHTASVLLLDSAGGFFGTIAYGENPETAKAKLKRLATEGS
jgi:protein SCO1/2